MNKFDETKYVLQIYNNCYGGGIPLLNKDAKTYSASLDVSLTESEKLLMTLEKYGTKDACRSEYTQFGVCLCPIECVNAFSVDEYDGLERPYINHDVYLTSLIKNHFITYKTLTLDEYEFLVTKSRSVELIFLELD
jgi:hypothetical protein